MGATQKVSLTMDRHALRLAKTAANRTGTSLSSLVNSALERHLASVLEELERRRAAEQVITTFPAKYLPSTLEQRELLTLWSKARPPTPAAIEALQHPVRLHPVRLKSSGHVRGGGRAKKRRPK
jgi:hypothetical protein